MRIADTDKAKAIDGPLEANKLKKGEQPLRINGSTADPIQHRRWCFAAIRAGFMRIMSGGVKGLDKISVARLNLLKGVGCFELVVSYSELDLKLSLNQIFPRLSLLNEFWFDLELPENMLHLGRSKDRSIIGD